MMRWRARRTSLVAGLVGGVLGASAVMAPFSDDWMLVAMLLAPFALLGQAVFLRGVALVGADRGAAAGSFLLALTIVACVTNGLAWVGIARSIAWARSNRQWMFWLLVAGIATYWGWLMVSQPALQVPVR